MSQYSHDEFDEVQPYRPDEVGKHRALGAAPAAGAAPSGMMKWIGLLAVAVIVILAAGWFFTRDSGDDDGAPAAEEQDAQDDAEAGDENGEGEGGEDGETEENGGNGDEEGSEDEAAGGLSDEFPVRAVNAGAPDGSAGQLTSELEDLGLDVEQSIDWDFGSWGTPNTPQIIYPTDHEQELAEALADELGIDAVSQNESWQTIVVVVGPEYQ